MSHSVMEADRFRIVTDDLCRFFSVTKTVLTDSLPEQSRYWWSVLNPSAPDAVFNVAYQLGSETNNTEEIERRELKELIRHADSRCLDLSVWQFGRESSLSWADFERALPEHAMLRDLSRWPIPSGNSKQNAAEGIDRVNVTVPDLIQCSGLAVKVRRVTCLSETRAFCSVLASANNTYKEGRAEQLGLIMKALLRRFDNSSDESNQFRSYIAWLDGEEAGKQGLAVATVSGMWSAEARTLGIYDVAVLPEYRGYGLGKMMTLVPALCINSHLCKWLALTAVCTGPALKMYERLNFEQVGLVHLWQRRFRRTHDYEAQAMWAPAFALSPATTPASDWAIFSDFDGTISTIDTLDCILDNASGGKKAGRLQHIEARVERGEVTVLEALEDYFDMDGYGPQISLDAAIDLVQSTARSRGCSVIDPAFEAFVSSATSRGISVAVLSTGFRSLIERLLPATLLQNITLLCHDVRIAPLDDGTYKWKVVRSPEAVSKAAVVMSAQEKGSRVLFVGDGLSDYPAAQHSDLLFVKTGYHLHRHCKKNGLAHVPVQDFAAILNLLLPVVPYPLLHLGLSSATTTTVVQQRRWDISTVHQTAFAQALLDIEEVPLVYIGIGSFVRRTCPWSRDQQLPAFVERSKVNSAVLLLDPKYCGQEDVMPLVMCDTSIWHADADAPNIWHRTNKIVHDKRVSTSLRAYPVTIGEDGPECPNLRALRAFIDRRAANAARLTVIAQFCVPYMAVPENIALIECLGPSHCILVHLAAYASDRWGTRVWRPTDTFSQDQALLKELARYSDKEDSHPSFGAGSYIVNPGSAYLDKCPDAVAVQKEAWADIDKKGGKLYLMNDQEIFLDDLVA